ncbi:hypothetical protein [Ruania alba]|uniref:Uncharacterized protein n=1 Tax=Ruania alba TaxID=648782 RepID=A0A1H5DX72_9MICO|nr:hypothetical protein [Ruania alba]SED83452.1 hypothetical protein SAMN04488554_0824 [Ruania alba]
MSTRPGTDSWRDAGLIAPDGSEVEADEPTDLVGESEEREPAGIGEDYHPHTARPDLTGTAAEGDVADQAVVVPGDDDPDEEF